jgi:hypothetical protein
MNGGSLQRLPHFSYPEQPLHFHPIIQKTE